MSKQEVNQFLSKHKGLIVFASKKYYKKGERLGFSPDDLHSFALEGMFISFSYYDPNKGAFSGFAVRMMRRYITNAFKVRNTQLYGKSGQTTMDDTYMHEAYAEDRGISFCPYNALETRQMLEYLTQVVLPRDTNKKRVEAILMLLNGERKCDTQRKLGISRERLDQYLEYIKEEVKCAA